MIPKAKKESAFSLIELIVATAILTILCAIALPSLFCALKSTRVRIAISALNYANKQCLSAPNADGFRDFKEKSVVGYSIQSDTPGTCPKAAQGELLRAIPDNADEFPAFRVKSEQNSQVFYSFRGAYGNNISNCISETCSRTDSERVKIKGCEDSKLAVSAEDDRNTREQKDMATQICSYMIAVVKYHDEYGKHPTLPDHLSEFTEVYGKDNQEPKGDRKWGSPDERYEIALGEDGDHASSESNPNNPEGGGGLVSYMTAIAKNEDGSNREDGLAVYACYNIETGASSMTMVSDPGPDLSPSKLVKCR